MSRTQQAPPRRPPEPPPMIRAVPSISSSSSASLPRHFRRRGRPQGPASPVGGSGLVRGEPPVEVHPQHPRVAVEGGHQEDQGEACREEDLPVLPGREEGGEEEGEEDDQDARRRVAEVKRAEEVALLPREPDAAHVAAVLHLEGAGEDPPLEAYRTALGEDRGETAHDGILPPAGTAAAFSRARPRARLSPTFLSRAAGALHCIVPSCSGLQP